MFQSACATIRDATYALYASSQILNRGRFDSTGTAFMIAPGILVTAAHQIHVELNRQEPILSKFEVIRASDAGQNLESASYIGEDIVRDIAFLKINNPRSDSCVVLESNIIPTGTCCGSLGFPFSSISQTPDGIRFDAIPRFQGAHISSFHPFLVDSKPLDFYETDSVTYPGSSGCPGFLVNGNVFGMLVLSFPYESVKDKGEEKPNIGTRIAISLWVPSMDIINFARKIT